MQILMLFMPAIAGLLENLVRRLFTAMPASLVKSGASGAALVGVMEYMGCDLAMSQEAVVAAIGALPMLFSVPPDQILPTVAQAMKERVDQYKKSQAVTAAAVKEQEKWTSKP